MEKERVKVKRIRILIAMRRFLHFCFFFSSPQIISLSIIKTELFQTNIRKLFYTNIPYYFSRCYNIFSIFVKQEGKLCTCRSDIFVETVFSFTQFFCQLKHSQGFSFLSEGYNKLGISKDIIFFACLPRKTIFNEFMNSTHSDHNPYKYNKTIFNKRSIDRLRTVHHHTGRVFTICRKVSSRKFLLFAFFSDIEIDNSNRTYHTCENSNTTPVRLLVIVTFEFSAPQFMICSYN